jgi:uncharacterized protein
VTLSDAVLRVGLVTGGREHAVVDGIPVLVVVPAAGKGNGDVALWAPFLGGRKEIYTSVLDQLAEAGFVAMAFDPRRHGERADLAPRQLLDEVMGSFRRVMWPILGGSVLDALAIADWALARYELGGSVVAGGVSMGGDIAVALAGIDPRVRRVVGVAATPDWMRPGMTIVDDPARIIEQGSPTALGQWLYERLDPMTNALAYRRRLDIGFHVGGDDTHVPGEAAQRFGRLLADAPNTRIDVAEHSGLAHMGVATSEQVVSQAVAWLSQA